MSYNVAMHHYVDWNSDTPFCIHLRNIFYAYYNVSIKQYNLMDPNYPLGIWTSHDEEVDHDVANGKTMVRVNIDQMVEWLKEGVSFLLADNHTIPFVIENCKVYINDLIRSLEGLNFSREQYLKDPELKEIMYDIHWLGKLVVLAEDQLTRLNGAKFTLDRVNEANGSNSITTSSGRVVSYRGSFSSQHLSRFNEQVKGGNRKPGLPNLYDPSQYMSEKLKQHYKVLIV